MNKFDCFSPIDYRYQVEELAPYLSEESFIRYKSRVEAALAEVLSERGVIGREDAAEIRAASEQVHAEEVYQEEARTGHDIIAQVNMIRKRVSDGAKPGVHRTATSYDIVDTANAMRYRDAFGDVIIPDMVALEREWIRIAREEKDTLQIGRTHLQHAEPITFGFAMASYVSRLGKRIAIINDAVRGMEGKFSGAVGAYNASSLFFDDPEAFEEEVLARAGLAPCEISSQIVQPEPMADLAHGVVSAFAVLANWADDMRNLQRPEIAEIGQPRGKDVSRSSTMPHKANPVGLENIKSMFKASVPSMQTMYQDQISDHQRDLTNSASQRFIPQMLNNFDYSVRRASRISKNMKAHPENMRKNFMLNSDKIMAEPLHLLLSAYGHPSSHEHVAMLSDESYRSGRPLIEIAMGDRTLEPYISKFTARQVDMLSNPDKYTGIASRKAQEVCDHWEKVMDEMGY